MVLVLRLQITSKWLPWELNTAGCLFQDNNHWDRHSKGYYLTKNSFILFTYYALPFLSQNWSSWPGDMSELFHCCESGIINLKVDSLMVFVLHLKKIKINVDLAFTS